jgi:hypothetical protein
MRKILLLLMTLVAAFALAQNGGDPHITAATHGKGVALSQDGRKAEFGFEAQKFVNRKGAEEVRGNFHFAQVANNAGPHVKIHAPKIGRLGTQDKTAEFAGPAVLVVRKDGTAREFKGRIVVAVADLKEQKAEGDKADHIKVSFKADKSDMTFEFGGAVTRGDIVVRTKPAGNN